MISDVLHIRPKDLNAGSFVLIKQINSMNGNELCFAVANFMTEGSLESPDYQRQLVTRTSQ